MGSNIALPALHIQPPPDPSEGIQRMVALKGMLAQQAQQRALMPGQIQAQQQQIQAGALDIQKQQQALQSQKAHTAAWQQWDGKDPKQLGDLIIKNGGTADDALQMQKIVTQQKGEALDLVAKQGTEAKRQADLAMGAKDQLDNADPKDRPAMWGPLIQGLHQQGVDVSQLPQQYPGDDAYKAIGGMIKFHSVNVDQALKTAETAKNTAQAGEATAQTRKINAEISPDNPADPNLAKTKYQGILAKIQAGGIGSLTVKDYQWAKAFELAQRKTTTQSDSLGVSSVNTSGPSGIAGAAGAGAVPGAGRANAPQVGATGAGGGQAQPTAGGAKQSIVDMVGQYRTDPALLSRMFIKHPEILGMVQQKYPDFDQTNYTAKSALIKGMTSGSQSKEINAVNTAMGHIGALDDAIDALHNGNVTLLNKIGTAYNINVAGKTPEAAFKLIANRVGPEIATAYVAGGGGEHERDAIKADFDVNLPPQTLHNNAAKTVDLLRSKIGALENQYKTTVQRDDFTQRFITPQAQASLQKFAQRGGNQGGSPGGSISVTAPNGKTYNFPNQAAADAFKQRAGIK